MCCDCCFDGEDDRRSYNSAQADLFEWRPVRMPGSGMTLEKLDAALKLYLVPSADMFGSNVLLDFLKKE